MLTPQPRDHGGGIDAAVRRHGGSRIGWVDLSTGINPLPYPVPKLSDGAWHALPDTAAMDALCSAARRFWNVPDTADILAAPGASPLIAQIPSLCPPGVAHIPGPTYNEHEAAFRQHGWTISETSSAQAQVLVHPNNPTGKFWSDAEFPASAAKLTVIDESFCDVAPDKSLMPYAAYDGAIILKSFGKFWGLAGLRLGFAIGDQDHIARLRDLLGPWAVSGPSLEIGAKALNDIPWADATRARLSTDSARLDQLMLSAGAHLAGGTPLFRLYKVDDAQHWQNRLAQHHIWSRIFPYDAQWLRLGLPHPLHWPRLEAALA